MYDYLKDLVTFTMHKNRRPELCIDECSTKNLLPVY